MFDKDIIKNEYFLTIISAILLILSFPPFSFSFLIWFSLVPFFYIIMNTKFEKISFHNISYYKIQILSLIIGVIFYFGTLYWFYNIFNILGLGLLLILAMYIYFFSFLTSYLINKNNSNLFSIILFPTLWTIIEYFKSEGWYLKFSWMNLGYTQHNFLPILQFANIFGQYGITFLIVLINTLLTIIIINLNNKAYKKIIPILFTLILIFTSIIVYGNIMLSKEYEPKIPIMIVQDENSNFNKLYNMSNNENNASFIIWPEFSIPEFIEENPNYLKEIQNLTKNKNSYLIVGSKDRSDEYNQKWKAEILQKKGYSEEEINNLFKFYNTAYLFSPEGEIIGKYYKNNPIQFFADGVKGNSFPSFDTSYGKIGILICYDMDYSYVSRNLVKNNSEILFIPTLDKMSWSYNQHLQHSSMTSMRAVENNRYIVRSASSGISQIIDPNGRTTLEINIGESSQKVGHVNMIQEKTFYTNYGYLFPFFLMIILLILVILISSKNNK